MNLKKIIIAKNIGFCFGVNRAINIAKNNAPIFCIGDIIHNKYVVNELIINHKIIININPPKKSKVLIRAHGISLNEIILLKKKGCLIVDATCPFVSKIHNIVKLESLYKRLIIIFGLKIHPEIIGICGWINNSKYIVISDILELYNKINYIKKIPITIVVQTTFDKQLWYNLIKIIKQKCENYRIYNTICSATFLRQNEIKLLSKKCDTIFIFGDKLSSNSKKLYDIALPIYKQAIYISSTKYDDKLISNIIFKTKKCIAIAAGASTPKNIINNFLLKTKKYFKNI